MIIARIIDVSGDTVTYMAGRRQVSVSWPGALPRTGDVWRLTEQPFAILEKLSSGGIAGDVMRWRKPNATGLTRMEALERRHVIRKAVREYLDGEGFLEIDMPLLVRGTTPDAEIESFAVGDRYLATSTEYQIKRMEIGGFDKVYTLTQNYRAGDTGQYRNPEFTMLEWARVGGTLLDIESDAENFTLAAHRALGGGTVLEYMGAQIDLTPPWDRQTVSAAILEGTGVTVADFSAPELRDALKGAGLEVRAEWEEDRVFLFTVLLDHLQGGFGLQKPLFLIEWPSFLTSSANESGGIAERSELFIAGVEVSDGFPSLTGVARQKAGFESQLSRRRETGAPGVALDQFYLDAMAEGLPNGAGMALGFDRLVMLLTGQHDIHAVLAYSWTEV